jgi:anti-sigma regulatory factor (Ser/Thr protein kinase)
MSDTLRLEHGIRAPALARRWIVQRCREWECPELADSAALLVSELVTNVFLHARTDCSIHATFDRSVLAVTVADGGSHELVVHPASTSAEDGRGLAILEAVADEWGIERSGGTNSVWFHLIDQPPPAHPRA